MKLALSSLIVLIAAACLLAAGANLPRSETLPAEKVTPEAISVHRPIAQSDTSSSHRLERPVRERRALHRVHEPDLSASLTNNRFDADSPPSDRTLTPDLIDRCLEVADEVDPVLAMRLRTLCVDDPAEFDRVMQKVGRRFIGLAELKARDPVLYRVKIKELQHESQVHRVAHQLAAAMESDDQSRIRELEAELRNLIRVQVAMSIKAQGDYLKRLKEHVQALEARIEREAANFDQTVEQRLEELVQQSRQTVGESIPSSLRHVGENVDESATDVFRSQPR